MDDATRNAGQLIRKVTIALEWDPSDRHYQRTGGIVGGAEALK
jgi:F0F1-type ATP synthase gamma subunit